MTLLPLLGRRQQTVRSHYGFIYVSFLRQSAHFFYTAIDFNTLNVSTLIKIQHKQFCSIAIKLSVNLHKTMKHVNKTFCRQSFKNLKCLCNDNNFLSTGVL